ncbi:uncharacterized protein [Triticum aestivum]|uniref:uncharacterized protein n=1 Tax=Triticum aestivum TaxID=4565 RepID=UPI00098B5AA0|nr:uncharacterized protein LOC109770915 [Aegilops tauschii subsp. strangulata]XP_044421452.1 uncharacterized protein LOC123145971 [Triticum aestivum]
MRLAGGGSDRQELFRRIGSSSCTSRAPSDTTRAHMPRPGVRAAWRCQSPWPPTSWRGGLVSGDPFVASLCRVARVRRRGCGMAASGGYIAGRYGGGRDTRGEGAASDGAEGWVLPSSHTVAEGSWRLWRTSSGGGGRFRFCFLVQPLPLLLRVPSSAVDPSIWGLLEE